MTDKRRSREASRFTPIVRGCCVALAALVIACGRDRPRPSLIPSAPIAGLELRWGKLVAAANFPTGQQSGTGTRVGFFLDSTGTLWGIPLSVTPGSGRLHGCAPPELQRAPVTDSLSAEIHQVIGATNAPTGYRMGTGRLELLGRDRTGAVRLQSVAGGDLTGIAVCDTLSNLGYPKYSLPYYRLVTIGPAIAPTRRPAP